MTGKDDDVNIDSTVDEIVEGAGLKEAPQEPAPAADTSLAPQGKPAAPAPELSIPKSVPKDLHESYAKWPKEAQDFYTKREKDWLDGNEQYRRAAEYGSTLNEVISPYTAHLQARGVDAPSAIKALLNADYLLTNSSPERKAELFAKLAKDYGVDLTSLPKPAAADADPRYASLIERQNRFEEAFLSSQHAALERERVALSKQVDAFASDPKHSYFDEVADHVVRLLTADQNLSLEDAYEQAVWANPVTRTREQARLDKEREVTRVKEAEAAAAAAKRSKAPNVRGTETRRVPTAPPTSMDETLVETLAEINSRT
jgi:hypothetical protein